jgi:hypothetical protein
MAQVDERCDAEVVRTQSLGMRALNGDEIYALVLRVVVDGQIGREVEIGSPVPLAAMPLLRPGTTLPALRHSDGNDTALLLDWETAIANGVGHV